MKSDTVKAFFADAYKRLKRLNIPLTQLDEYDEDLDYQYEPDVENPIRGYCGIAQQYEMPGCCGIAITTAQFQNVSTRGQGYGQLNHLFYLQDMKRRGYTLAMCTNRDDNHIMAHILEKFGWENIKSFVNNRTGNRVSIWIRSLDDIRF
jgi:hypothetical protein